MRGLLQDVRFALRQLRKNPAIHDCGYGDAGGGDLRQQHGVQLDRRDDAAPDSGGARHGALVSVMRGQWNISPTPPLSYLDYRDLREQNHSFEGILAYHHDWLTLTGGATPERIYVANVSANYFDVLGVKPLLRAVFPAGRRDAGRACPMSF